MGTERRKRRSDNTTRALGFQLDSIRRKAHLEGMVLSDEHGVCLARSGDPSSCDEVAARIPLVGRKVREFDGVLYSAERGFQVRMRRFHVGDTDLYVCAIGGLAAHRKSQVTASVGSLSRILDPVETAASPA